MRTIWKMKTIDPNAYLCANTEVYLPWNVSDCVPGVRKQTERNEPSIWKWCALSRRQKIDGNRRGTELQLGSFCIALCRGIRRVLPRQRFSPIEKWRERENVEKYGKIARDCMTESEALGIKFTDTNKSEARLARIWLGVSAYALGVLVIFN